MLETLMDILNRRLTRSQAMEESDNVGRNDTDNPTMGDIIEVRFNRRELMRGALAVTAISATLGPLALASSRKAQAGTPSFGFTEVAAGVDPNHHIAPGYQADILIRWGDPVLPGAPTFDPGAQTAEAQKLQFGYNNDFLGYFPIGGSSEHGLLVVHHEYTNEELMFPGLGGPQDDKAANFAKMTKELADIEMAAHGGSVIEVRRVDGRWQVVADSKYARRITADTPMEITGPAAGDRRMQSATDPTGTKVAGMLNQCAGGVTPWGTWLATEENFHGYFWGKLAEDEPQAAAFKRYGVPANWYNWGAYYDRFDVTKDPNEANRFGWIVEIDPFNPTSTPKKRTALGRFKHEGAMGVTNKDGRYVVYSGDDERFDYVYKFVTAGTVDTANPAANRDLLDNGTLYVARYDAGGGLTWLPLVHGEGPLTAENGFASQADVVINARLAADAVGATKMDRPEDVEVNPTNNSVYVVLTNNNRRKAEQVDAANPRAENLFGHIVEMIPPDGDHAATNFTWDILVRCGDPSIAEVGATFGAGTTKDGWFGMPDNCAVDPQGRLWISTDGNSGKATGRTDGVWAMEIEGESRGTSKLFFRCPAGAELCGPMFTPDGKTLFVAVQHPADDGDQWPEFGRVSTFEDPSTRWPDFKEGMPPRPSIVVITKADGAEIGA
jgi:secreted PhoX family phosphatase